MKIAPIRLFEVCCILLLGVIQGCSFFSPVMEVSPNDFQGTGSSKLVVGCFISPQDTVIRVSLGESNPLYDTLSQSPMVEGARIVLYNEHKDSLIIDKVLSGYYVESNRDFPITGGETYHLLIKAADGRTVRASCTVPLQAVPITAIVLDSGFVRSVTVGEDPIDSTMERYTSVQWTDPVGLNYYRATGYLKQSEDVQTDSGIVRNDIVKLLYFNEENSRLMIQSDKNQDGGKMQSGDGIYWRGKYSGKVIKQEVVMSLLNTDKTYYDYYQSINRYDQADENPFAEPANIVGNIEGGYGCFASFNESSITLKIK